MTADLPIPTPAELEAAARASLDTATVWEIAFHEAGHAIVPINANRFPEAVYINDDLADTSHAGRNVASVGPPPGWASSPLRAIFHTEARLLVTTLLAGHAAEAHARGSDSAFHDDREWAESLLEEAPEDADAERVISVMSELAHNEAVDLLAGCRRDAMAVLEQRWSDVQRLASRLVQDRRLERDDLWAMFPDSGTGDS